MTCLRDSKRTALFCCWSKYKSFMIMLCSSPFQLLLLLLLSCSFFKSRLVSCFSKFLFKAFSFSSWGLPAGEAESPKNYLLVVLRAEYRASRL